MVANIIKDFVLLFLLVVNWSFHADCVMMKILHIKRDVRCKEWIDILWNQLSVIYAKLFNLYQMNVQTVTKNSQSIFAQFVFFMITLQQKKYIIVKNVVFVE